MDSDGCGILQMQIWGHVVSTDGIDSHLKPLPNIEKPNEHLERRALHCHSWTCLQVEVIQIIEVTWIERQRRKMHVPPNTKHIEDPNIIPNKFKKPSFNKNPKLQRFLGSSSFESFPILNSPSCSHRRFHRRPTSGASDPPDPAQRCGRSAPKARWTRAASRIQPGELKVWLCLTAETEGKMENHGKSHEKSWKIMENHGKSHD